MDTITCVIWYTFWIWVGWRIATWKARHAVVVYGMSAQHEVTEYHYDGDRMVIDQTRIISVTPIPITQYDLLMRVVRLLWHNAKQRPRLMTQAIINVLRKPRP